MLRRWISELARFLSIPDPLAQRGAERQIQTRSAVELAAATAEEVAETFASVIGRAAERTRVVVLIDALNQFEATTRAQYLTWLPMPWSPNARLLATAIPGVASSALTAKAEAREQPLSPVTVSEARQIATRCFRDRYHREPNARALEALLGKESAEGRPAHGNPLWLELSLHEMNLLEADDYARAEREFSHLPGGARMEALLVSVAERLPAEAAEVYGWLLERAERDFGTDWARGLIDCIALGRAGWRESDLRALVPAATGLEWDELAFAGVRRTLGTHLVQRGAHAQWDVFHAQLREAVLGRDLPEDGVRRRLHGLMVDHLQSLPDDDPLRASETMVHVIGRGSTSLAARYLARTQPRQWTGRAGRAELSGAVGRLAEWLEDESADAASATRSEWAAELLAGQDLEADEIAGVANVLVFDLNDTLSVSGGFRAESARGLLLERARQTLEELLERDEALGESRRVERDLSVSLNKLGDFYQRRGGGWRAGPGGLRAVPPDVAAPLRPEPERCAVGPGPGRVSLQPCIRCPEDAPARRCRAPLEGVSPNPGEDACCENGTRPAPAGAARPA